MLYLVALFVSPLAVLLCGKPMQALLNLFLFFLCVVPGIVHACFIVNEHYAEERMQRYAVRR